MPQTTIQILRCLTLGRYTATVEDDELKIRGPRPLAGPLPATLRDKANRDELIAFLEEWAGAVWPPARVPRSGLRELQEFLNCGLGTALDVVEAAQRRRAA
jgi:hypothetical protein